MALDVSKNWPVKVAVYSCLFWSILCHFLCSNLEPGAWGGSVCTGLLNLIVQIRVKQIIGFAVGVRVRGHDLVT